MIKTILISSAAAASLGASTQTNPQTHAQTNPALTAPSTAQQFEIIAGPMHWSRKNGATEFSIEPSLNTLFSIKIGEHKAVKIHL